MVKNVIIILTVLFFISGFIYADYNVPDNSLLETTIGLLLGYFGIWFFICFVLIFTTSPRYLLELNSPNDSNNLQNRREEADEKEER